MPSTLLYPRDPSLDPQLVWKGKDEQDRAGLSVPAVPVYIQEKIHPQALIENLCDTAKAGEKEPEQLLFADFNGLDRDFDRKIDFYSHELGSQPKWSNRMILGDSLLVMASLAEKEGLKGQGPDDLPGPALWHQVRLKLARLDAQAGRTYPLNLTRRCQSPESAR
jgi:adenine-specific DNA-methyltransferase